ncbi:MAG: hypothetical protein QF655_03940 [Candidatus Woesearchaeota archaeon]|jgi:hypothetical protein|nr:hypothetical protein [Candidatus Woesearchaeota archaeon]MDP6265196.1 hypothetical protein [Candidatus Woesearchaeota archaeon]MDP7476753.1 hypothetical protein [Candidatus Woesearchaeota archaeon]|tara:strand:+ start:1552 stop:2679 length:1128 start_codon:yes stop_codon:yes gene_type:complete
MKKKDNLHAFLTIGIFVLLGILLFNSFFVFSVGRSLNVKIDEAKELARPAELGLIQIESSCSDCFDIDSITNTLKESSDIKIIKEKLLPGNSKNAIKIINQYGIEKLPVIVLTGEIEKASIQNFKQVDDVLVFNGITPPYEDAATKKVMGKVSSIIISDNNCAVCIDLGLVLQNLKQSGVFVDKEEEFDFSGAKAKALIGNLDIEKLPALLLSDDIEAYPDIAQSMDQAGLKKQDYYIIESQAPYVEAESGKIRGTVDLILLDDSSCSECYDVEIHKSILARLGLAIGEEETIDTSSEQGKQLISQYNLESVPTIILTGDLEVYENLDNVWPQVGTVEDDGAYVFREITAMGQSIVYRDVDTGEIKGTTSATPTE